MSQYQRRVEFRCDKEMELYLRNFDLGERSIYIRDLISKDRIERIDPIAIKNKIKDLQQEIQQLNDLKNQKNQNEDQIRELLEYHSKNYKINATVRTEAQRIRFIKKSIQPQLTKLGSKYTAEEIDDLLIEWPE